MKNTASRVGGQPTDPKAPVHPAPLPLARVPFRGGFIEAAQIDGDVFVPLRPLCDRLGVSAQGQLAKLRAKPWAVVKMILSTGADGKTYLLAAVDLRSLPLWLATIEPSRVKPEARPALVAYQREAVDVLYRHFLAPPTPGRALPEELEEKAEATRVGLRETMWVLNLPLREPLGTSLAPRQGGASVDGLCADVAYLKALLGFDPSGDLPDGVLLPTLDSRSQAVLRLRAWMTTCTRPLTHEEQQGAKGERGVTAQQAADSYNRWAQARGLSPMSAASLGRWLADSKLHGYQRTLSRKGHRYQFALLPAPAAPAASAQLPGEGT